MKKLLAVCVIAVAFVYACGDLTGTPSGILSIQFDSLAAPAVVVGDTLRDTAGAVVHPVVHAFNYKGAEIESPNVRFQSPDSGVTVDSITGVIRADSLRSTTARIYASVGSLQALQRVDVTLRPDLITPVNSLDSISYSLVDSSANLSPTLTVKVTHGVSPNDSAVRSWIVSFNIVSEREANLGTLVNDSDRPSSVDTTGTDGVAGRKIRLHPAALGSPTEANSIIVNATAKYRGVPVSGSPVRLVVRYKPHG